MAKEVTKTHSVKTLPPLKSLFTESWANLKMVMAPFIIFNIVVFLTTIVAIIMMVVGVILIGVGGISFSNAAEFNPLAWGAGALSVFVIFFIIIAVISSISHIGSIIILFEGNPKIGVISVVKRSAKYIIPMILTGIVMGFLTFGGLFLFIIPGIIFSILFTLAYYSLITENAGPIQSLKRSVYIVKNNFSGFFIRVLALWGILFLVNFVLSMIITGIAESSKNDSLILAATIINVVLQIGASFYSIAYSVTLFKQLQAASGKGESSLKVITILSIIGWIIAIVIGYFAVMAIPTIIDAIQNNSESFEDELTPEEREDFEKIFQEIDGELNIEDLDRYMEESTGSVEVTTAPQEAI